MEIGTQCQSLFAIVIHKYTPLLLLIGNDSTKLSSDNIAVPFLICKCGLRFCCHILPAFKFSRERLRRVRENSKKSCPPEKGNRIFRQEDSLSFMQKQKQENGQRILLSTSSRVSCHSSMLSSAYFFKSSIAI